MSGNGPATLLCLMWTHHKEKRKRTSITACCILLLWVLLKWAKSSSKDCRRVRYDFKTRTARGTEINSSQNHYFDNDDLHLQIYIVNFGIGFAREIHNGKKSQPGSTKGVKLANILICQLICYPKRENGYDSFVYIGLSWNNFLRNGLLHSG